MNRFMVILSLLLNLDSFGKIWIVDSNAGSTSKDFTNLQSAHTGAAAGDTLYLIGSPTNYITSKVTITKRLVIIGPGYFLNENPDTQANILSAFLNNTSGCQEELEFGTGSDGSVLMGVDIIGSIVIKANNVLVKRNHIHQEGSCTLNMVDITASNIFFVQNFVDGSLNSAIPLIQVNGSQSNVVFSNNYLFHSCSGCGASVSAIVSASSALEISNNVIRAGLNVTTSLIQNNIFTTVNNFSATASVIRNNLHGDNGALPGGNGNVNAVTMANVFVGTGSTDGLWKQKAGSIGIGGGFGGTDCGIFGGTEPYILSGIPPIPTIYSITTPVVGDKINGLPVQIKVKARN